MQIRVEVSADVTYDVYRGAAAVTSPNSPSSTGSIASRHPVIAACSSEDAASGVLVEKVPSVAGIAQTPQLRASAASVCTLMQLGVPDVKSCNSLCYG